MRYQLILLACIALAPNAVQAGMYFYVYTTKISEERSERVPIVVVAKNEADASEAAVKKVQLYRWKDRPAPQLGSNFLLRTKCEKPGWYVVFWPDQRHWGIKDPEFAGSCSHPTRKSAAEAAIKSCRSKTQCSDALVTWGTRLLSAYDSGNSNVKVADWELAQRGGAMFDWPAVAGGEQFLVCESRTPAGNQNIFECIRGREDKPMVVETVDDLPALFSNITGELGRK